MGKTAENSTYCRGCFYDLRGIGTPSRCPECGRPFDLADPKTFRTRRPRNIWRRLRWVVYPLLMVVLALAGAVGWVWWGWRSEQPGIAWVRQSPYGAWVQTESIRPTWVQIRLGRWAYLLDRAATVATVEIAPGSNVEQSPLWRLQRVDKIGLQSFGVTDEWLEMLCRQLNPRTLTLFHTAVTDNGLAPLRRLRNLEWLYLDNTPISDDGLAHLTDLPELTMLSLCGTRVRGPGLAKFGSLPKLKTLSLDAVDVEDSALEQLAKLEHLEDLDLRQTKVRGPGLAHLKAMPKLTGLCLVGTLVDDSAVEPLTKLTQLSTLDISETKITPEGVARLKQALPNCQITAP